MSRADDSFDMYEWLASRSHYYHKIMIVEFNTGGANFIPVQQGSARQTANAGTPAPDSSVSLTSQSLKETFQQASAPRPEKVAQANALLNDGTYPSDAALTQLAGFLAKRI